MQGLRRLPLRGAWEDSWQIPLERRRSLHSMDMGCVHSPVCSLRLNLSGGSCLRGTLGRARMGALQAAVPRLPNHIWDLATTNYAMHVDKKEAPCLGADRPITTRNRTTRGPTHSNHLEQTNTLRSQAEPDAPNTSGGAYVGRTGASSHLGLRITFSCDHSVTGPCGGSRCCCRAHHHAAINRGDQTRTHLWLQHHVAYLWGRRRM